jgi:hypothetical protein
MVTEDQPTKGPKESQGILARGDGMWMAPPVTPKICCPFLGRRQFDLVPGKRSLSLVGLIQQLKTAWSFKLINSAVGRGREGRTGVNRRYYWCQAKVGDEKDLFQVIGMAENIENDVVLRGAKQVERYVT